MTNRLEMAIGNIASPKRIESWMPAIIALSEHIFPRNHSERLAEVAFGKNPVIYVANHPSLLDLYPIHFCLGLAPNITGPKIIPYSASHDKDAHAYQGWVNYMKSKGYTMIEVEQAYRRRIAGNKPATQPKLTPNISIIELSDCLKPYARTFVFPEGHRNSKLNPAEPIVGYLLRKGARSGSNLQVLPVGIIPKPIAGYEITFGYPRNLEFYKNLTQGLKSYYDLSPPVDDSDLLSHAVMWDLCIEALPETLWGVYHPENPLFKEVLNGTVKLGMEAGRVILVKKVQTSGATCWERV